ncbi:DUF2946 family protein [Noviherbaspirillum denitrificans]|uniref:DUF2946 domain-containing protein n=1 Tax=Noviherbaspirillum denitrificans TaxID=1968433 RepID=A0A254TIZ7_9BURK|nr:DUF2946 family protein [Noviherbaspirillum denitrificans]OWW22606.1 hypothetical protein AYR66_26985 [Noviherbaspirillum denitrificans]
MDEIVKQAMAKWPNVPHCYGWLALDARGNWRMRDERAQALKLAGDRIGNPALLGFINRNYLCDDKGRWYFQNGPQRVYINLEATPFIARTDPVHGLILHTGDAVESIDAVWMTENGLLLLQSGGRLAQLDDRDMAQCLVHLHINGMPADDERLLAWLGEPSDEAKVTLEFGGKHHPVARLEGDIAQRFGFTPQPQPDAA